MTRLTDALRTPQVRYMGQIARKPIRALVIKIKRPLGDLSAVILAPVPCIGCGLAHGHTRDCPVDMASPEMMAPPSPGVIEVVR